MEATSFHFQHQLQEEFASATSAAKSDYNPSPNQSWIPSNIQDVCDSRFATESITCSGELGPKFGIIDSRFRAAPGQDFGFHDGRSFTQQYSASDLLLARINDEVSDNLPKLNEMISSPSRAVNESHSLLILTREPQQYSHNFLSGHHVIGKEPSPAQILCHAHKPINAGMGLSNRWNFGGVSSNSNLSALDLPASVASFSLGLKSQMLDPRTSYGRSCGLQLSYDAFELNEMNLNFCHSNLKGRENSPSNSSNKITAFGDGVIARTKRPGNSSHPKNSEAKTKKSRPSCPPLKVRKEKLGDRIQTLQKLVAPFGKTDTASVLTEAIGYIHFLHDQIQTFSVSHMKSWPSKPFRTVQLDSKEEYDRESKPDLRSRGLCLLPLAHASVIHH